MKKPWVPGAPQVYFLAPLPGPANDRGRPIGKRVILMPPVKPTMIAPATRSILAVAGLVVLTSSLGWIGWGLARYEYQSVPALEEAEPMDEDRDSVGGHRVREWSGRPLEGFGQAPLLEARVETGDLPPVAERLPENPLEVEPPEQIGPYGGTWRRLANGPNDIGTVMDHRIGYDGLVRWDPTGTEIWPNLAHDWEIADDGRTFIFHLRRGVRWSDGHPFTADDILFWYEGILKNTDITPTIRPDLRPGGELVEVDKLDDHTVEFRFAEPHGLFIEHLASGLGMDMVRYPLHYFRDFHPDYVDEDRLLEMARDARFQRWHEFFEDLMDWRNDERPTLTAWVLSEGPPARTIIYERNPYYWKVDPEGNQLPYIDRISYQILNREMINFRALGGFVEMQSRHMDFDNLALFLENRAEGQGDFRVLLWDSSSGGSFNMGFNQNHRDPVMREIIRDRRFRIALSHAINRDELNEVGFFGLGTPRQNAPPRTSLYYDEKFANAHIEYDPEKANRLLDEMGLERRDKRGNRLRPDGRPVTLTIELTAFGGNAYIGQMIAEFWSDVGVKTEMRAMARELFMTRAHAVLHDVGVWSGADEHFPFMDPRWFFPYNTSSFQGVSYARWFMSRGEGGEEPPPEIRQCMDYYWEIERTLDSRRRAELFQKILDLNREHLWVVGTVGEVPEIHIVKNHFRNVPDTAMAGWSFRTPGNTAPECYAMGIPDDGRLDVADRR